MNSFGIGSLWEFAVNISYVCNCMYIHSIHPYVGWGDQVIPIMSVEAYMFGVTSPQVTRETTGSEHGKCDDHRTKKKKISKPVCICLRSIHKHMVEHIWKAFFSVFETIGRTFQSSDQHGSFQPAVK